MQSSEITLYGVPGLSRLKEVADGLGVRFSIIGSLPRRLLLAAFAGDSTARDLFDLVPFTSDIDLVHDGPPELTPDVVREIAYTVPFSELYRWQIASTKEREPYTEFLRSGAYLIPDNLLTLDEDGLHDPAAAALDYSLRRIRFVPNAGYHESALYLAGRDLPVFAALLALRNALQAAPFLDLDIVGQPALEAIAGAVEFTASSPECSRRLAGSGYLKSRLVYLFTAMSTSARSGREYDVLLEASGLARYAASLHAIDEGIAIRIATAVDTARSGLSCLVSATVGDALFRAPAALANWIVAEEAANALMRFLRVEGMRSGTSDPAFLVSEPIALEPGEASCAKITSDEVQEFLHVHIPLSVEVARTVTGIPEDDMAVAISLCELEGNEWRDVPGAVLPVPSVCSFRYAERREQSALQVRLNVFGLLERLHETFRAQGLRGKPGIRLIFVQPIGSGEKRESFESAVIWREGNARLLRSESRVLVGV
jgi:hypothetical protein